MAYKIAVNGYGRIGQSVLRVLFERGLENYLQPVAINELADIQTISYLTRFDTTHGRFPRDVSVDGQQLKIGEHSIRVINEREIKALPWNQLDVDLLFECSGSFSDRNTAELHLNAGAKKLLFSQPARADVDATLVYGINHTELKAGHRIASAASCTTNCIVPVLDILDKHFGVEYGVTTTIHSAMNDQPVIDAYHHTDLRLTRSALQSIIPVDTSLDLGIDRLLPQLAGRFQCLHVRVPTINVSLMDISVNVARDTDLAEINAVLKQAAEGDLRTVLGYTEEPQASVDFNSDTHSVVVDATQTRVSGKRLVKLLCWFDNEWGFANRMIDIAEYWLALKADERH